MRPDKYAADEALVDSLRNDDPGAWNRYKEHCGDLAVKVIGTMLAPAGLSGDIADVHQDSLVKALATWDGASCAFKTWLIRIAVQLSNNRLKQASRRRENLGDLAFADESEDLDLADDVAERVDAESQAQHLRSAIKRLPGKQRFAVVARYYLNWEIRDIANYLGLAESSVRVYIARALSSLRGTGETN